MSGEQDAKAFKALTEKIFRARGICCEAYKEKCLRRRIAVRMRARGAHTYDEYARLLDEDVHEYERLLDALTINVTKFFRNAETWEALRRPYLEGLWRERQGQLHLWSAGCASGEEPYTLAIMVAETARALGHDGPLARVRIDATDIDRESLERTRAAEYPESAFSEMPAPLVRRYFHPGPPFRLREELLRLVRVRRHDLIRDGAPNPPYDLITCRNVVIYFDRPIQEQLFLRFAEALRPGGILLLGKVETLLGRARDVLRLEDPRERIYRKPA